MTKRLAEYDYIVVGGGFFGSRIAVHLGRQGKKVLLLEKELQLLQRASFNNQARVHNGYHYPRSVLTALRSRVNLPLFEAEYSDCIVSEFEKYYAISRRLSKVTSLQFHNFCNHIGAEINPAEERVKKLFDATHIEEVFKVKEHAFNATKLQQKVTRQLSEAGVTCLYEANVSEITQAAPQVISVQYAVPGGEQEATATTVLNCTYSHINTLNQASGLPTIPLKYELAEVVLTEVPDELQNLGVTVMCGPFFSLMPFPARNLHSLTHVRYTPHLAWEDGARGSRENHQELLANYQRESNFVPMIKDAARYLPLAGKSVYKESLWEVKTFLAQSDTDDSRPILFKRNHGGIQNYHCIMGGKIDNIYDALGELDSTV